MWHIIFGSTWLKGYKGAKEFIMKGGSISTRPQSPESNRNGKNSPWPPPQPWMVGHVSSWSLPELVSHCQTWCQGLTQYYTLKDVATNPNNHLDQTPYTNHHVNSIHVHSFADRRVRLWHDRLPIFKYICRTLESTNGSYNKLIELVCPPVTSHFPWRQIQ